MGDGVNLIDSAEEMAWATKDALSTLDLLNQSEALGKRRFFVSDSPDKFKKISKLFLGAKIGKVGLVDINSY
jgi:glutamate racemase